MSLVSILLDELTARRLMMVATLIQQRASSIHCLALMLLTTTIAEGIDVKALLILDKDFFWLVAVVAVVCWVVLDRVG